ncbi:nuclear RNA export factor 1 [Leptinotarsa decemlineata]|uniref:nuclear RNA export factor 1 n=1 Tax=Leptinotarsa decemlineata TaxID=7539 RepID=UPI003D307EEF
MAQNTPNINVASMKPNSSSVMVTSTNLPTGIIFKNKALLTNINCWHKFIINNAENSSRNNVLRAILDHVHPLDLIPVSFYTDNLGSYFLARNCGPAIQKLCNDNLVVPNPRSSRPYKISIILKFSTTGEFKIDVQKNIINSLTRRYDVTNRTLNMVKIHEDPELTEFCPMSQPKIMFFLLHLAKNLTPPPEKYLMNDNRIKILNPMEALSGIVKTVTCLDLRNNLIEDLNILQPLKVFQLKELYLDGNPLCEKYGYEEYVEGVKNYCKHLEILDGITVKLAGFPSPKKNYFCDADGLDVVNQFLERYFMVYDSNNRKMLQELYHKNAMFSLNSFYYNGQFSSATTRLYRYNNISRNLHKMADFSHNSRYLFQGNIMITNTLCGLAPTEHDPFSFCVDLMYHTHRCAIIGVTGIFKESPETLLDSEKFYGFRRTFVLEIVNGDGLCHIVNEQLHIHNAFSFQIVNSFKQSKTVIPNQMRLPQTDKEQQQVVDTLRVITNLNVAWSKKCLEECHYDLKKALIFFTELYKADKIPKEALCGNKKNS